MKRISVIAVLIVVLLTAGGTVSAQQEIVVSTPASGSSHYESAKNILTEAYKQLGFSLKIIQFPTERSLLTANNGNVDGELFRNIAIETSYPNLIRVPVNILPLEFVVFTKDKYFPVKGWQSLQPYCVGYMRGVKSIEQNIVEGTCTAAVETYKQAFLMLNAGRNDIVIAAREQGKIDLETLGLKDMRILEPPLIVVESFHYLHKKNQSLVAPLTAILKQMETDGTIREIQRQIYQSWYH